MVASHAWDHKTYIFTTLYTSSLYSPSVASGMFTKCPIRYASIYPAGVRTRWRSPGAPGAQIGYWYA